MTLTGPNLNFKVTVFFNISLNNWKMVQHYSYTCNGRLIRMVVILFCNI